MPVTLCTCLMYSLKVIVVNDRISGEAGGRLYISDAGGPGGTRRKRPGQHRATESGQQDRTEGAAYVRFRLDVGPSYCTDQGRCQPLRKEEILDLVRSDGG